jgi:hypothetical protein
VISKRYILIILIALFFIAAVISVFFSKALFFPVPLAPARTTFPHVYKNSDINISEIDLKIFYVVPKNKADKIDPAWREDLGATLERAVRFHELQFRELSKLKYEIFPEPVILKNDDDAYDTANTNAGNPHGLINIGEEIEARVFKKEGDLYSAQFSAYEPKAHRVIGFVYEGVGASGGLIYDTDLESAREIAKKLGVPEDIVYVVRIDSADGFFILNKQYISGMELKNYGPSILYHEFAHTIGLPDLFDENNSPSSNDVMGSGREKQIENTYLGGEQLKAMGVI